MICMYPFVHLYIIIKTLMIKIELLENCNRKPARFSAKIAYIHDKESGHTYICINKSFLVF